MGVVPRSRVEALPCCYDVTDLSIPMSKGHGKPKNNKNSSGPRSTSQPPQDEPPTAKDTCDRADKNDPACGEPAPLTQIDPSPQSTNKTKAKWYQSFKRWKSIVEFVGILFAIGYAIVTGLQWYELHHNFRVDERAWIGATSISGFPQIGKQLLVTIMFKNTGKTPALKVFPFFNYQFVSKGDKFVFETHRKPGNQLIAPNVDIPGVIPVANAQTPFTQIDSLRLRSREKTLYVYGQIWYQDIFHHDHWLKFCYFLEPMAEGYAYTTCNENNEPDQDYE